MFSVLRGGTGLDQPDLRLQWTLGKPSRERTGQAPSTRHVAPLQGHPGRPLERIVGPRIVGGGTGHLLESRLG